MGRGNLARFALLACFALLARFAPNDPRCVKSRNCRENVKVFLAPALTVPYSNPSAASRVYTGIRAFQILHQMMGDPDTIDGGLLVSEGRKRRMNANELREKTPDQLRDQLTALKKEAFNLRFQQATGQLEGTARMRGVRRDAARVLTILNQKATDAAK